MIFDFLTEAFKLLSKWPDIKRDHFRKAYANWRAGYELRKANRGNRASILESVDKLLYGKNKLP
jgi:hypothetical protein